jgi:hypothetical protein
VLQLLRMTRIRWNLERGAFDHGWAALLLDGRHLRRYPSCSLPFNNNKKSFP